MSTPDADSDRTVIATATLTIDHAYLGQRFDDWLHHVSRWRKRERKLAIGLIVVGLLLLLRVDPRSPTAIAVLGIGVFELGVSLTLRWRWVRKAAKRADGAQVEFCFAEEGIFVRTEFERSVVQWAHYRDSIATPTGLFLGRKGSSIYIPDTALTPRSAKAQIVERLGARATLPSATAKDRRAGPR